MRQRVAFILLLSLALNFAHTHWFTERLAAPFKYLKRKLLPDRMKFKLDTLDPLHREAAERFIHVAEDGLGLTYTLIYYNLMLNLERECIFVADQLSDCDVFVKHIQQIITHEVKTGSNNEITYPLIEDFYNKIFDLSKLDSQQPAFQTLKDTLEKLGEYFNGPQFEETKQAITISYNDSLKRLHEYLNSKVDQEVAAAVDLEQIEDNEYIDF